MILDTLDNAAKYVGLKFGISEAFGFLDQPGLADLPDGKYEIHSDRIFAIIAHENGRAIADGNLEGHRKYLDIQYLISGDESIGWSPRKGLKALDEYDPEDDIEFFKGTPQSVVRISPNSFAIFLSSDAHLPLIGKGPIHKVVIKVAIR